MRCTLEGCLREGGSGGREEGEGGRERGSGGREGGREEGEGGREGEGLGRKGRAREEGSEKEERKKHAGTRKMLLAVILTGKASTNHVYSGHSRYTGIYCTSKLVN